MNANAILASCALSATFAAASRPAAAAPENAGALLTQGLAALVAGAAEPHLLAAGIAVSALVAVLVLGWRRARARRRHIRELEDALAARDAQAESLSRRLSQTIHELELAHHRLHEQAVGFERKAHLDALTGLANRLLLDERIGHGIVRALRHNARMAVVIVELRGLDEVAERCGRPAADELRIAMAARLRSIVRAEDTVARLDGERFAAVLEEVFDQEDVQRVLTSAAEELGAAAPVGDIQVMLAVRLGYAFFPENGKDATALLAAAATMLQGAGADGRPVAMG